MPITAERLTVRGFAGMSDSLAPDDPRPFLLTDCYLHQASNPQGGIVGRTGWYRGSATPVTVPLSGKVPDGVAFEFVKLDGTFLTVLISGGTFYTLTVNGGATNTLTAAQLTAAGVTIDTTNSGPPVYAVPYNNQLVISDGVNTPWMWDGTAGGGITKLTNAPVAYGPPTVYFARLWFIKNTSRGTVVWSEVNAANTGYEAGGYTNFWQLSQTATQPLFAILGTNSQLYYWRASSIGSIRGAVTSTFSSDGTHDSSSMTLGTTYQKAVAQIGDYIWFVDGAKRLWRMEDGGDPQPIAGPASALARRYGAESTLQNRPYNLGEDRQMQNWVGWAWDPLLNHVFAVWTTEVANQLLALVFDYASGTLVGTEQWPGMAAGAIGTTGFASGQGTAQGLYTVSSTGIVLWRVPTTSTTTLYGQDQPAATGATVFTPTVIGPAQGYQENVEWDFQEIEPVFETNSTDSAALLGVDYLTDQAHYSTLMEAQQTVAAYDATYLLKEQRARFGINGHGGWIRARAQLQSTGRMLLKGWQVLGYPVPLLSRVP